MKVMPGHAAGQVRSKRDADQQMGPFERIAQLGEQLKNAAEGDRKKRSASHNLLNRIPYEVQQKMANLIKPIKIQKREAGSASIPGLQEAMDRINAAVENYQAKRK